ncbi:hypothetical protein [Neorhodopirellula pilleata]|uniref:DUF3887 domain-containing protein n=1 Tax=Neorhodopirellula pilleata TaxID=2714738 RepID=A0A5C6A8F7_9BACT|nr:hypothetical protein [Neorhodopirellula pilleata]TWT95677.1 hypothetical protein Pla100_33180 [Neorhodopirellula pilleata]
MKTLLRTMFVIAATISAGIGLAVAKSPDATLALHTPIHNAIAAEDTEAFMALCVPGLENEIDRPLLLTWMQELNRACGANQQRLGNTVEYAVRFTPQTRQIHTKVDLLYQNGVVSSSLVIENGLIAGYSIQSDSLDKGWFQGPSDASLYFERSEKLLVGLLNEKYTELEPLMHPALNELVTLEKLQSIQSAASEMIGDIESVVRLGGEFESNDTQDKMTLKFRITGDQGEVIADAVTIFDGMKGSIIEFNYTPVVEVTSDEENAVAVK